MIFATKLTSTVYSAKAKTGSFKLICIDVYFYIYVLQPLLIHGGVIWNPLGSDDSHLSFQVPVHIFLLFI